MFGLGLGLAVMPVLARYPGGGAAAPGATATSFTTAPQTQFHPHSQAGAVTKNGSVITACPDIKGLAALSAGGTTGPVEMTDALGRKFWRFEAAAFAQIAATFAANTRGVSAILTGRIHRSAGAMLSCGLNGASPPATSTGLIHTYTTGGAPYVLRPLGILSTGDAANRKFMACGHQLQVLAVRAGTTAGGGQRCYVNTDKAAVAEASLGAAFTGMELGRYAASGGSAGSFDLYELALFTSGLAASAMDTAVAEAVANWQIPQLTATLLLEGDSRVHQPLANTGIPTGRILGMLLTDPGAGYVPGNYRVLTMAASGNMIADMTTRKNAASPGAYAADMQLTGERHVAYVMGTNDGQGSGDANYPGTTANTVQRGDAIVAADKAMIYDGTGAGLLEKGWTVTRVIEPQQASNSNVSTAQMRLRHREAAFLTDTLAGAGQTYDGKLRRLELPLLSIGGFKPFDLDTTVAGNAYYNDTQHPNAAGAVLWASGGDTPQYGWGAVV